MKLFNVFFIILMIISLFSCDLIQSADSSDNNDQGASPITATELEDVSQVGKELASVLESISGSFQVSSNSRTFYPQDQVDDSVDDDLTPAEMLTAAGISAVGDSGYYPASGKISSYYGEPDLEGRLYIEKLDDTMCRVTEYVYHPTDFLVNYEKNIYYIDATGTSFDPDTQYFSNLTFDAAGYTDSKTYLLCRLVKDTTIESTFSYDNGDAQLYDYTLDLPELGEFDTAVLGLKDSESGDYASKSIYTIKYPNLKKFTWSGTEYYTTDNNGTALSKAVENYEYNANSRLLSNYENEIITYWKLENSVKTIKKQGTVTYSYKYKNRSYNYTCISKENRVNKTVDGKKVFTTSIEYEYTNNNDNTYILNQSYTLTETNSNEYNGTMTITYNNKSHTYNITYSNNRLRIRYSRSRAANDINNGTIKSVDLDTTMSDDGSVVEYDVTITTDKTEYTMNLSKQQLGYKGILKNGNTLGSINLYPEIAEISIGDTEIVN